MGLNPRKFCQKNVKREDHDQVVPIMRSKSHQHDQPRAEITAPLKQELILGTKRSPISCGLDHSDEPTAGV